MPQFQLEGAELPAYQALDAFTRAYIEAAFFTQSGDEEDGGTTGDKGFIDLAPETLAAMIADCAKFQADNRGTLARAYEAENVKFSDHVERAGHDFWLTRNGHGAGFWDGDWPEPYATQLTEAAKGFGEVNLLVGDDGLIYAVA